MIQWEGSSGRIIRSLHVPDASVRSVAFSRSGKLLALSFSDGTIRVVATDTFREIMSESLEEGAVTALSFSADDRVLVAGTSGGEVGICKLAEDRRFVFAKGHPEAVLAVAGHPTFRRSSKLFLRISFRRQSRSLLAGLWLSFAASRRTASV